MHDLDETDVRILELLTEDARRPYSDIAEDVDLSAPAVSDRVQRLQEAGVIRRLTVDLDRSQLRSGALVLVSFDVDPGETTTVSERLRADDAVEHVFTTVEGDVQVVARMDVDAVRTWATDIVNRGGTTDFEVTLLADADWTPSIGGAEFALACAECGNTVTSEGESARLGGERYHFCCPSCRERFEEKYEQLANGAR